MISSPAWEWARSPFHSPSTPPSSSAFRTLRRVLEFSLGRERVVNGGVFSIPQGTTEKLAAIATRFFEARKRPWRMASLVGPAVLIRFLSGRLRVADLETMALHVLQVPAQALRGCAPELAFDVDTAPEYLYATTHE